MSCTLSNLFEGKWYIWLLEIIHLYEAIILLRYFGWLYIGGNSDNEIVSLKYYCRSAHAAEMQIIWNHVSSS